MPHPTVNISHAGVVALLQGHGILHHPPSVHTQPYAQLQHAHSGALFTNYHTQGRGLREPKLYHTDQDLSLEN